VDGATTRQSDGERFVVAVPEGNHAAITGGQHVERLGHHGTLDAASRDRSGDLATLGNGHRRARQTWPGALHVDDASQCDPMALTAPSLDVVDQLSHARRLWPIVVPPPSSVRSPGSVRQRSLEMTPPKSDGRSTTVTPWSFIISTFSAADSPGPVTMAPAWPMVRPLGADRPAM